MSQRKAIIGAWTQRMKDRWEDGDFTGAQHANEVITRYEQMTDKEFNDTFLGGQEIIELGEQ